MKNCIFFIKKKKIEKKNKKKKKRRKSEQKKKKKSEACYFPAWRLVIFARRPIIFRAMALIFPIRAFCFFRARSLCFPRGHSSFPRALLLFHGVISSSAESSLSARSFAFPRSYIFFRGVFSFRALFCLSAKSFFPRSYLSSFDCGVFPLLLPSAHTTHRLDQVSLVAGGLHIWCSHVHKYGVRRGEEADGGSHNNALLKDICQSMPGLSCTSRILN